MAKTPSVEPATAHRTVAAGT
ncbi:hypothetical protein A2U01_0095836, partial [Trifolium medium]|nr:hypothetical protein [Trifolium medium]